MVFQETLELTLVSDIANYWAGAYSRVSRMRRRDKFLQSVKQQQKSTASYYVDEKETQSL